MSWCLVFIIFALARVPSSATPPGNRVRGHIPTLDGRIVGGVETSIRKFPHQISIRYFESHRCGGSIYKAHAIITAAHCIYELMANYLIVVAGSSHLSDGGIRSSVKGIYAHSEYNSENHDYDIAIVLLEIPFDFSETVQPIALASVNEEVRDGTRALVSGWGTLIEGGTLSDVLQYVDVIIVKNEKCAQDYEEINAVTERMLCAGYPAGAHDSCQGDLGGPLSIAGRLYGIVSWGYGCARKDYPGVYVKVAVFRNWIEEIIGA